MQKIVSFHRRIANPPIPSHGGCRHLKHSKHWTYNAVLGTSSLTKMDEFPIQKHYIEATFDQKRKHKKHKCQHFSENLQYILPKENPVKGHLETFLIGDET